MDNEKDFELNNEQAPDDNITEIENEVVEEISSEQESLENETIAGNEIETDEVFESANDTIYENPYNTSADQYGVQFPSAVDGEVVTPIEVPEKKNKMKIVASIIAAVLVVILGILILAPQVIPFNLSTKKFEDTKDTVRVMGDVLKGKDGQVYYVGGKLYISVSDMAKALEYGEVKGTRVKLKIGKKTVMVARNAKRINGHAINNRVFAHNNGLFIAYDDVPVAFDNLKTATLSTERKCIYDAKAYVKSGQTLKDLFDMYTQYGAVESEEDFRTKMGIPAETSLDIDVNLFQNNMTLAELAKARDMSFEDFKNQILEDDMGIDEKMFKEEVTVGEIQDMIPLSKMFGEENFDKAIEYYGLTKEKIGFEPKKDDKFEKVRNIVMLAQLDEEYKQTEETEESEPSKEDSSKPEPQLSEESSDNQDSAKADNASNEAAESIAEAPAETPAQ